jgi:hypothetical protein
MATSLLGQQQKNGVNRLKSKMPPLQAAGALSAFTPILSTKALANAVICLSLGPMTAVAEPVTKMTRPGSKLGKTRKSIRSDSPDSCQGVRRPLG